MQNHAWKYSMTATVLAALTVLVRWLQCETVFDEEGLAQPQALLSWVMTITLIAAAAVLWWLSGRMTKAGVSSQEPETALAKPNREIGALLIAAAAVALIGTALLFLGEAGLMMRLTALLGLLAVLTPAALPHLSRWGGFGAFLSVIPVVFFSLWLIIFYKNNAVNPTLWYYGPEVLAIAACLMASYHVCGYLFYRINARNTLFSCGLALVFSLAIVTDPVSIATRLTLAGWGVACGAISWLLVRNFTPPEKEEAEY